MLSWLYILQGIGMIAVGAIAIIFWYKKKHISLKYFLFGGILWAVAITIKLAMDYTITRPLNSTLVSALPIIAVLSIMSLYFGLRTGIFESGITYLVVKNTKLSQSTFDEAIALGIGFGGAEALILGVYTLLTTFTLLLSYETLNLIPLISFDWQALIAIPIPIVERLLILICHVFATVLIVYAVNRKDVKWLCVSVGYMTMLDGVLLPLEFYLGQLDIYKYWLIELIYAIFAIIGLIGLYRIKRLHGEYMPKVCKTENIGSNH